MISAIILAGGEGRRMNHENKGLIKFKDKPLIEHVINAIAPQVDEILISANNDLKEYERYTFPVIKDQNNSYGPLSGIETAATAASHNQILVVPCDMPILPSNLVSTLATHHTENATSISWEGRRQPLLSLIDKRLISTVNPYLSSGKRSVIGWLESISATVFDWPDTDNLPHGTFRNVNSIEELEALEGR